MSRDGQAIIFVLVLGCICWIAFGSEHSREHSNEQPQAAETFHGYDCTVDCSGHQAGYDWAEEHSITDGDDCDAAGEHSNSPSFAEGCHAYVDGDDSQPDDTDGPISAGDDDREDED